LLHQLWSGRTQRGANGDLARPAKAADEQKGRYVHAGDEQQQRDRCRKHDHRGASVPDDETRQRVHDTAHLPHERIAGRPKERRDLRSRGGRRRAWREATDDVVRHQRESRGRRRWNDRSPEVDAARIVESLRHHPDDRERHSTSMQREPLAEHAAVAAELTLPRRPAQHRHRCGTGEVVVGGQGPA
jgi:hypothetical protein